MRNVVNIHWSQLSMGSCVTAFIDDNRGRASSEGRSGRCFSSIDMRVMRDIGSWFTGIRAIDRTPAVADVQEGKSTQAVRGTCVRVHEGEVEREGEAERVMLRG
jgi:hypothetical protein